jgi:hypothetical protein
MTNVVRLRPPKHREYDPLDNVIADPRYIFSRPSGRRRASLLARLAAVLRRAFSKLLASR